MLRLNYQMFIMNSKEILLNLNKLCVAQPLFCFTNYMYTVEKEKFTPKDFSRE